MVDKNVAYNRGGRAEEFAENDPLAELARIVGYEDRPRHVAQPAPQPEARAERREPEFNLEDELLREFAEYDAPREETVYLDPANDTRGSVHASEFLQRVEDVFSRREPELEQETQYVQPLAEPVFQTEAYVPRVQSYVQPNEAESYQYSEANAAHAEPSLNATQYYADEPSFVATPPYAPTTAYAEPAVYDAPQQVEVPTYQMPQFDSYVAPQQDFIAQSDLGNNQADYYQEPVMEQVNNWQVSDYTQPAAIDMVSELEQAIATQPVMTHQASTPAYSAEMPNLPLNEQPKASAASTTGRSSLEFSTMRLPLANFGMSRATPTMPKAPVETAAQAPVQAMAPMPSVAPVRAEAPIQSAPRNEFEGLIDGVSDYTVQPASLAPRPQQTAQPPVQKHVEPVLNTSSFDDFELTDIDFEDALASLDLDLNDLAIEPELSSQSVRKNESLAVAEAPVRVEPPQQTQVMGNQNYSTQVQASPAAVQAMAATRVAPAAPVSRVVTSTPNPDFTITPYAQQFDNLPFDPDQIGDTEEHPEAITNMDVPDLPAEMFDTQKAAPVSRHDDDLDLDTELAILFNPAPSTGGLDRHRNVSAPKPAPSAVPIDEFEKELEEDFRRSMQQSSKAPQTILTGSLDDLSDFELDDEEGRGRSRLSRFIVPVAATVGVIALAGGLYSVFFAGSNIRIDGAPIVISADNEPMKVVPENPGGRIVPNQDKAVYDRVAGNAQTDPTQPALISTNEEPIDVVQRTLIPETSPIEDDGLPYGTPVEDTSDPRLLSPQEQAMADNEAEETQVVAPRRVRTMIVKPDGTLVTQEVEVPQTVVSTEPVVNAPTVASNVIEPVVRAPVAAPAPVVAAEPIAAPMPQPVAPPVAAAPAPAPEPVAPVTVTPVNTASSGGYYVQIASLPSQAEAEKTYQTMANKYASVIGGRGVDIKEAVISGKGTYYRVRIPAGDRSEAAALCERFRSAGGSCLVAR